jgi:hypothetical protein
MVWLGQSGSYGPRQLQSMCTCARLGKPPGAGGPRSVVNPQLTGVAKPSRQSCCRLLKPRFEETADVSTDDWLGCCGSSLPALRVCVHM